LRIHFIGLEGFALYEQRPDKSYSLTDCISMTIMRQESLTDESLSFGLAASDQPNVTTL